MCFFSYVFFLFFFYLGFETSSKIPQLVQDMILEVCERINFGSDLTHDVFCWTRKLLKNLNATSCYTRTYPVSMAVLLTARDHGQWISNQLLFNYFQIPPSKMFKYIKLVKSKIDNTDIDCRHFKNMIGYVRQCGIMSHLQTEVLEKMYERFSYKTDLSPIHIITCIIVHFHNVNDDKIKIKNKMKLVEICNITGTRPNHVKKILTRYKCILDE